MRQAPIDGLLDDVPEPDRTYLLNYIRHKRLGGLSESTIGFYIRFLKTVLSDLEWKDAMSVTQNDIEDWYLSRRTKYQPKTLVSFKAALRSFMQFLHGRAGSEMVENIRVKAPLSNVRTDELLSDDEVKRMMEAAASVRDRAIVALFYSSGCRLGEIYNMCIGDVVFKSFYAVIHVNGKTGERDVTLFVGVPELKAWLNVHPFRLDRSAPLFVTDYPVGGRYNRLSYASYQQILHRLAVRAGIPENKRTHPHALRHKRATDVADHMTIADMKEMFGWSQGSNMANVYVHSSPDKVARKLAEIAGVKVPETAVGTTMVRQCPKCMCINAAGAVVCANCGAELAPAGADELTMQAYDQVVEYLDAEIRRRI